MHLEPRFKSSIEVFVSFRGIWGPVSILSTSLIAMINFEVFKFWFSFRNFLILILSATRSLAIFVFLRINLKAKIQGRKSQIPMISRTFYQPQIKWWIVIKKQIEINDLKFDDLYLKIRMTKFNKNIFIERWKPVIMLFNITYFVYRFVFNT